MNVVNPHERLRGLWSAVDAQHNAQIAHYIHPTSRVLDIGCGYGSLVNYLTQQQIEAVGIDYNAAHIETGRMLFPQADLRVVNAEQVDIYPDASFDVIVLKDTLHHLVGENDIDKAFATIRRLLVDQGQLIIYDPNPTRLLKMARQLIKHVDFETTQQEAHDLLKTYHFSVTAQTYYEICGLVLSGGYVGVPLVPHHSLIHRGVAGLNHLLSRAFTSAGLGSAVCWRYLIVARKTSATHTS